jgi:hypothetical protein
MALVTSAYVYSATHEFLSDVSVPSRVGTSTSLTNKIYAGGVFRSDPIYFPSLLALETVATILFIDTGVATTSRLVFYNNAVQGFPTTPAAGSDATIYPAGYLFDLTGGGNGGTIAWGAITGTLSSQTDLQTVLNTKQNVLVSGTNLKTVNSQSLLGPGDLTIAGGSGAVWGGITGTLSNQADLQAILNTFAVSSHGHIIDNITGLQTALDGKATTASVTTVSTDLASLTTVVAGKQNTLGFTPENISNKATNLTSPDNTKYPTTLAVSNAISGITKSTLGLSLVENTTLSTWTGSTTLATLGTIITGTWNGTAINDTYISSASVWNNKQNALVSGTNLKTINNESLLGSGNITITGGGGAAWGGITGTLSSQTDLQTALNNKISTGGLKTVNGNTLEGSGNIAISGSSPSITTLTDAATITPNVDTTTIGILLSLSQNTTIANFTGTPVNYQELVLIITSSAIRRIFWGTSYAGLLPNTTSGGGIEDYFYFRFNSLNNRFNLVSTNQPSDEVELSYLTSSLILTGNL